MVWYSHLFQNFPQLIVIHTVKGFGIVKKAEIDAFLELSCFFHDPADVGNLISGSSAFSKTSLNIWKFMVHVLLKPGLECDNRFKGLDLIDRVPDELWTEVRDIVQETGDQDHPHGKEMQKSKMVVWGGLTNSCEEKRGEKQRRKGKI